MEKPKKKAFSVVHSIVLNNSLRKIDPNFDASGIRSHARRYNAVGTTSSGQIAEQFLISSRLVRGDVEMGIAIRQSSTPAATALLANIDKTRAPKKRGVALPSSVDMNINLGELIQRRKSIRKYSGQPMPLPYVATIIRATSAITHITDDGGSAARNLRSVPSGGALYPVRLCLVAMNIDGLGTGVYEYDVHNDQLIKKGDKNRVTQVTHALALPGGVITERHANVICLLLGRPWRSMVKYGNRGMRYAFLEAGAMAEHINLAATALGVGSVDCGSFYDDEVHEALSINGVHEALLHAVILGMKSSEPM